MSMLENDKVSEALLAAAPEMLAMLKKHEWVYDGEGEPVCSECEDYKVLGGHAVDCALAALLAKAEGKPVP